MNIIQKFQIGLLGGQKGQNVSKACTKDIPKMSNIHRLTILKLYNVNQPHVYYILYQSSHQ